MQGVIEKQSRLKIKHFLDVVERRDVPSPINSALQRVTCWGREDKPDIAIQLIFQFGSFLVLPGSE
jgi:hypothetical protein